MTDHHEKLGRVVGVLQGLELTLRFYLLEIGENSSANVVPINYPELQEGEEVREDEMTNYDSLSALVGKFNGNMLARGDSALTISGEVVEIRDMLAHGRIFSKNRDMNQLTIFRFTRGRDGNVRVINVVKLDDEWYEQIGPMLEEQREKATEAFGKYISHSQMNTVKGKNRI